MNQLSMSNSRVLAETLNVPSEPISSTCGTKLRMPRSPAPLAVRVGSAISWTVTTSVPVGAFVRIT